MADATVASLVEIVGEILTHPAKVDVTTHASELKGGWEIWMQVEMTCALDVTGVIALREEHVYLNKTNLKSDLKVPVPGTNKYISVELKVQSKGQTDFTIQSSTPISRKSNTASRATLPRHAAWLS